MRAVGQECSRTRNLYFTYESSKTSTTNNYDKIINKLVKITKTVPDITMQDACEELRTDSSSDAIKDVYLLIEHGNAGDIPHQMG